MLVFWIELVKERPRDINLNVALGKVDEVRDGLAILRNE